jgi:aldose 1-epimerase
MTKAQLMIFNGINCIKLQTGKYEALIAYEIGSNVIRLHDNANNIEFFRFRDDETEQTVKGSPEVWGLPTLYLPNRFADGVLKTSDAVYQLPVNEKAPYNNHIHGFLHKRAHEIVEYKTDGNKAIAKTKYVYDKNDPFYDFLPIDFVAEFTFTLSDEKGLEYNLKLTNKSSHQMPISLATHTTINSPFAVGSKEGNSRIQVPIGNKCILNERCLPTGELRTADKYDRLYLGGSQCPVLQNIDNDMYQAENMVLNGEDFHGILITDTETNKKIGYEVSDEYKFWIIWNDKGFNKYFCPEPMTAMIDAPNLDMPKDVTGYQEIAPEESFTVWQRFFSIV